MPDPIKFPETRTSLLRNGESKAAGVRILEFGNDVSVCSVRTDGKLATGHVALHPDILPDLISQLVTMHVTRRPGEADLIRAIVEAAIPEQPQLTEDEIEAIEERPRGPGL